MGWADATPAQIDELVAAIRAAEWRAQPGCLQFAVDGRPYPPRLTLRSGNSEREFGVSDNDCAQSDHSASGDVMDCATYHQIHSAVAAILLGGHAPFCNSYW